MIPATLRPRRCMHSAKQGKGGAAGLSHLVCIHVEVFGFLEVWLGL